MEGGVADFRLLVFRPVVFRQPVAWEFAPLEEVNREHAVLVAHPLEPVCQVGAAALVREFRPVKAGMAAAYHLVAVQLELEEVVGAVEVVFRPVAVLPEEVAAAVGGAVVFHLEVFRLVFDRP